MFIVQRVREDIFALQIPDFDGAEEGQVLFLMLAEIEQLHHELCSALQDNEVEKMVEETTHGTQP